MNNILVSIVIPVYNSEKTIGKCLDSLLKQTYPNIEIICVNDFSKDNSLRVLEEYANRDLRVNIINHNENRNAGGARNTGIRAAKGYYICLVDNDDWLAPTAIESMVTASCCGDMDMVTSDWIIYYSEFNQVVRKNFIKGMDYCQMVKFACLKEFGILGCLWKKSIFLDNNLFYPEDIFYEDNAIAYTLMSYAKTFNYVEETLYYYVKSNTSVTGFTTTRKISDRISTTNMYLQNLKKHGFYEDNKPYWDFFCLKMSTTTIIMLSCFPYGEIKREFARNNDIIKGCLPNNLEKKLGKRRILARFPYLSFWLLRIKYKFNSKK